MAGREGFEPSRDIATPTHLAGGRTRPGYATSPRVVRSIKQSANLRTLAEGEGFEPPVTLLPQLFSRQPP